MILVDVFWLLPWAYLGAATPALAPRYMGAALIPLGLVLLAVGAGTREKSRL